MPNRQLEEVGRRGKNSFVKPDSGGGGKGKYCGTPAESDLLTRYHEGKPVQKSRSLPARRKREGGDHSSHQVERSGYLSLFGGRGERGESRGGGEGSFLSGRKEEGGRKESF